MAWRRLVVERMVAYGMDRDMCGWVLDDRLGFEPAFGKRSYAWDAERPKLRWMLSIVDKVVSLMMGRDRPACLVWDPITGGASVGGFARGFGVGARVGTAWFLCGSVVGGAEHDE